MMDSKKYNISIVSYKNTIPFVSGINSSKEVMKQANLNYYYPAECAESFINNSADISLVPASVINNLNDYKIITNYCIGAVGKVDTVLLLSQEPINKIDKILLDYQSRTSVELVKILAKDYWGIAPKYESTAAGYESKIKENTAGVVIGDRAFNVKHKYKFAYDLSEQWNKHTDLPFVFAVWVAKKEVSNSFINLFSLAIENGVKEIYNLVKREGLVKDRAIINYLTRVISYSFDEAKKEALRIFLEKLKKTS